MARTGRLLRRSPSVASGAKVNAPGPPTNEVHHHRSHRESLQRARDEAARLKSALRHQVERHDHMAHVLGSDVRY